MQPTTLLYIPENRTDSQRHNQLQDRTQIVSLSNKLHFHVSIHTENYYQTNSRRQIYSPKLASHPIANIIFIYGGDYQIVSA